MADQPEKIDKAPPAIPSEPMLIVAQLLVLVALGLGLWFLRQTTGGTLFLFSTGAPFLVAVAILLFAIVAIRRFRKAYSLFTIETYQPGQVVFRQGEVGDCAYFIQSGEVEVLREDEKGQSTVLAKLSDGKYFGEIALLSDAPRNATVRAVAPTKLATLGKENFLTMFNVIPSAHQDILKTIQQRVMKQAKN
jgi:signal-transduction protein with cAMP-binding, CBS, and nucleotidyltransferase domain